MHLLLSRSFYRFEEIPNSVLVILNHSEMGRGGNFSRSKLGAASERLRTSSQAGFTAVVGKQSRSVPRREILEIYSSVKGIPIGGGEEE